MIHAAMGTRMRITVVYLRSRTATAVTTAPTITPNGSASAARTAFAGSHHPATAERTLASVGTDAHTSARRAAAYDNGRLARASHRIDADETACVQARAARAHRQLNAGDVERAFRQLVTHDGSGSVDERGDVRHAASLVRRASKACRSAEGAASAEGAGAECRGCRKCQGCRGAERCRWPRVLVRRGAGCRRASRRWPASPSAPPASWHFRHLRHSRHPRHLPHFRHLRHLRHPRHLRNWACF